MAKADPEGMKCDLCGKLVYPSDDAVSAAVGKLVGSRVVGEEPPKVLHAACYMGRVMAPSDVVAHLRRISQPKTKAASK